MGCGGLGMYFIALLIGPFLLIVLLLVGGYFVYWGSQRRKEAASSQEKADLPINFGYKIAWIAIPAPSAAAVAEAIQLREVQPATWHAGLDAAYAFPGRKPFVTPPVKGWVLVAGTALPSPDHEPSQAQWHTLMATLSQRFGKAYFFANHRVSSYAAWALYEQGIERRAFAWADEILLNRGEPLPEEADRIQFLLEAEIGAKIGAEGEDDDDDALWIPGEDDVMELAGKWSIDPTALEILSLPRSVGLVGKLNTLVTRLV